MTSLVIDMMVVMNCIGPIAWLGSRRPRLRGRGAASKGVPEGAAIELLSWRINAAPSRLRCSSFTLFMLMSLLLPLADVAIFGFKVHIRVGGVARLRAICAVQSAA